MEHVHGISKLDGINRAIRVVAIVLYNLEYTGSGAFPRLRTRMFPPKLRDAQGGSDFLLNFFGEGQQINQTGGYPIQRFLSASPLRPTHGLSQFWDTLSTLSPYRFTVAMGEVRTPTEGPDIPSPLSMTDCSGSIQNAQMAAPTNSRPADTPNGATQEPLDTR